MQGVEKASVPGREVQAVREVESSPREERCEPEEKAKVGKKCVLHNKVMSDYGNAWFCDGPPSHKVFKS